MTTRHIIPSLLLASALALGAGAVRADDALPATPTEPAAVNVGLLGQVYGTLSYGYINLDATSVHADNYRLAVNQPLAFGLDGLLSYDFTHAGDFAGAPARQHTFTGALRAFSTSYNWGKPYVEAGIGFTTARYANDGDDSYLWEVAGGVEFQVAPATTVTPYVQYGDTPDLPGAGRWKFGVKANHWVSSTAAVTAGIERDDDQNTMFTIGTNFRF